MSDPNYNANPPGGYSWDDEDYRRHNREVEDPREEQVKCAACGKVVYKDDAVRESSAWVCGTCAEAIDEIMRECR